MSKNYQNALVAVNAVIFTIRNRELWVYLEKREKVPFKNYLELPGGLLVGSETAEETLKRKINNIEDNDLINFEQFYTFTNSLRDPRSRAVSIGFVALIPTENVLVDNFYDISSLPKLAFDHKEIITRARQYLKDNIDNQVVKSFMPTEFPLNDLQMVHEVLTQRKYDNRNYRKKMLSSGSVKKVQKVQKNVNHRPATLYKFV